MENFTCMSKICHDFKCNPALRQQAHNLVGWYKAVYKYLYYYYFLYSTKKNFDFLKIFLSPGAYTV